MHIPVLIKEVLEYLDPKPNENFIDATLGQGGHTKEILKRIKPKGRVLGINWDKEEIKEMKIRNPRLIVVNDSYVRLKKIIEEKKFGPVNGILFDLGMSSWHLEKSGKGFSFQKDEPLDMRYNRGDQSGLKASEIVNKWNEEELTKIFKDYGEEKFSKRIAREIKKAGRIKKIETTFELVEIIQKAIPLKRGKQKRIHPATRVFQALRIAVNNELDNLAKALPQAADILAQDERLAVISFHSLEDRIVKNFFKQKAKENKFRILTKKPIKAAPEEINFNPRARSAKLRAILKIK